MHQYLKFLIRTKFQELLFNDIEIDKNRSILLLANHFSFWDGLILHCINDKLFKKNFYVMINEATAYKINYLQYGGAFSINKNSRGILESLEYAANLLNDPQNLVLLFPQGKLFSNFVEDVHFEKGILRVIKQATGKFQLIFASTFIQFYKHRKQSINVYLKSETESYADKSIHELKDAYQQHYNAAKKLQTEIDL
ncbi:1-acyl-sn-glycerol-3-phosphate acyltransferase [Mucilaginibacter sp.]|uniref:1-acyl-sn-glycerol-3-phosphate acyltransferase n=1 Tax=Mucilaginibacter sp. TaxID=1882438 RepID=UPI00262A501C|nr:1-acyl-sn-glycerol-3-phosphate acyltransferase [Mucilaginibacter sp.]MDB4921001.1 glycerol acyltransferase [Mucilaginibacter sp.]